MSASLGRFAVTAEPAEVAAFRRAARLEAGEAVPFTYPIHWLARPEIRVALVALVPEGDLVPFHESQTFDYAAPLQAGAPYTLEVAARRESGPPDRLVMEATIAASDGTRQGTVETILRLFPTRQALVAA